MIKKHRRNSVGLNNINFRWFFLILGSSIISGPKPIEGYCQFSIIDGHRKQKLLYYTRGFEKMLLSRIFFSILEKFKIRAYWEIDGGYFKYVSVRKILNRPYFKNPSDPEKNWNKSKINHTAPFFSQAATAMALCVKN